MNLAAFFDRNKKVALQFSAGKDSAACLWMLQPFWDQLTVVWCNMGNPYQETVEYMEKVAALVPRFEIVRGNQPEWIVGNGYPADIVPARLEGLGSIASGEIVKVAPFWKCCQANAWEPLQKWVKQGHYDGIIRGQKNSDTMKAPLQSGDVVDGVEYCFPLEGVSDLEVVRYLGEKLPASYLRGLETSLDCLNCTAYASDNVARVQELRRTNPSVYQEIRIVHEAVHKELQSNLKVLGEIYG